MAAKRKLILRHTSGSKNGHVDEFPLEGKREVALGRDAASEVRFDDSDDLVSRQHAKLSVGDGDPPELEVTDLGSSNGTFVNKQRLSGSMNLRPGDVVQLGAGGPELEVDLDPRPEAAKATRMAEAAPAATRVGAATPARSEVGKATVERMITDTSQKSHRQMLTFAAILLAVVAVVVLVVLYQGRSLREEVDVRSTEAQSAIDDIRSGTPLEPSVIAAANSPAVVKIELAWRLVDSRTGEQIYHRYWDGLPAYVLVQTGSGLSIQPWLWEDSEEGTNEPIFGAGHGSGFVVTETGFILTNRHVASGWDYPYLNLGLPGQLFSDKGELLGTLDSGRSGPYVQNYEGATPLHPSLLEGIMNWVPSRAYSYDGRAIKGRMEGRLDRLDVVFPKTKERIPARLIRVSDRADAALIKIDVPRDVETVEMHDSYDVIGPGDRVIVMGYPGVSQEVGVVSRSVDLISQHDEYRSVPEPTVTVGGVGRIYRASARTQEDTFLLAPGDLYQLTINATGKGNSGGPVFDDYGRVVAIFTYAWEGGGARVTGAVPIKYGMDLLEIQPVL